VQELKAKLQEMRQQLEAEKLRQEQVWGEGTAAGLEKMGRRGKSDKTQGVFKAQVKKGLNNILWRGSCLFLWKICPPEIPVGSVL